MLNASHHCCESAGILNGDPSRKYNAVQLTHVKKAVWKKVACLGTLAAIVFIFLIAMLIFVYQRPSDQEKANPPMTASSSERPKLIECAKAEEVSLRPNITSSKSLSPSQPATETFSNYQRTRKESIFQSPTLLISESGIDHTSSILTFDINQQNISFRGHFLTNFSGIIATIGYDLEDECLFLGVVVSKIQRKSTLLKSCQKANFSMDVIAEIEGLIEDLAVDYVGKNILWTLGQNQSIQISNYDGSLLGTLEIVRSNNSFHNLEAPKGISVDPEKGFVFWTDWGSKPHIGRCDMDGRNAHIVYLEPRSWPTSLVLDPASSRVFFVDARTDEVRSMDYDGKNQRIVGTGGKLMKHPHALDLDPTLNALLWNDWRADGLIFANLNAQKSKFEKQPSIVYSVKAKSLFAISVVSPHKQPKSRGNCADLIHCQPEQFCVFLPDANASDGSGSFPTCLNSTLLDDSVDVLCMEGSQKCKSENLCIPLPWICDGEADCSDGSDEENCDHHTCEETEFKCAAGSQCVWESWVCDGTPDCEDGSDELHCV